ncbi:hypothetical protein BQ8794_220056 [Mesorhizobium prunaredense]|uniref:Uncharacterized protein n=1 Tax=Mesorhizobium prunaredense TaxID=1631249 RepID=A0A1R3V6J6_9HYPH|nr:hypothetical protein BQ8794_220056 [Mesorhizobium prunaredense]
MPCRTPCTLPCAPFMGVHADRARCGMFSKYPVTHVTYIPLPPPYDYATAVPGKHELRHEDGRRTA